MGAIVAALSKGDNDAVPFAIMMLEALIHRGTNSHEVVTPTYAVSAESFEELRKKSKVSSSVAIGRNVSGITPSHEQFRSLNGYTLILEGRFFSREKLHPSSHAAISRMHLPHETAKRLLRDFEGHYAFAAASLGRLLVGRDALGVIPLYYGENGTLCAVASERKALWKIGITEVNSFPPGSLATINRAGFAFKPVVTIRQPPPRRIEMHEAATRLQNLLLKSTQERVHDVEKVAVAFSGGVDSGVIARLTQKCGVSVNLISVGLKGQSELMHVEEAAKALCLPITVQAFKIADVEKALSKVLWLIEEPDVMKVSVAIPSFWTAQTASKLGCHVLLAGQGADELFGGYQRYLAIYRKYGVEKVTDTLYDDTITSYEKNFQRDEPVSTFHRVDLRLPFADTDVVRFALSLPLNLKIESESDGLRKRVLRQAAVNMDIPTFISDRPKKAIQYATGVDKAVRDLARSKGLTPREYVEEVFRVIYPNLRVKQSENSRLLQPQIS